ncbi:response regulator transcription factor [Streptomyces sp. NPDC050485]|uniref:response regulator transcription factor n=1 Tax=Streptomyces sp. NPDC050485 TaxID=3365617 RepID=UPI0037953539
MSERAYRALLATGARPRRKRQSGVRALTEREQRIATLATTGRDNQAIATALFVSRRTVEFHLTHVYRKLAIDGRAELSAALTSDRRTQPALPAPTYVARSQAVPPAPQQTQAGPGQPSHHRRPSLPGN